MLLNLRGLQVPVVVSSAWNRLYSVVPRSAGVVVGGVKLTPCRICSADSYSHMAESTTLEVIQFVGKAAPEPV